MQTDLGPNHGADPRAMPLSDFIAEILYLLQNPSEFDEIVVERCRPLRFAVESGHFEETFKALNEPMS